MKQAKDKFAFHVFIIIYLIFLTRSIQSCPSVCACKWKNGKQTVECDEKNLSSLPEGIEVGTQVLSFTGNNLQVLRNKAFLEKNIINLQKLYLSECKIGEIRDLAFAQLTNLVLLDLSKNILTDIPTAALKHAPAIRELTLAGNPIDEVRADAFAYTPSLVHLDLSNSKIKYFSPKAFRSINILQTLHIEHNKIEELPRVIVENLADIHGLYVHHNPWYCDCRALPLWRLLVKKSVPHLISPECSAPRRVSGTKFSELEEENFACPPEILPVVHVVKSVAGENATLVCAVNGQPRPDVIWYINDQPVINGSTLGVGPQRTYIVNGEKDQVSKLVITGAQESDSGDVKCIAVNPAGQATANFTLAVTIRPQLGSTLNTGHIAGISIGLIMIALVLFIIAFLLFAKGRSSNVPDTRKNDPQNASTSYRVAEPNPIQKPPRVNNLGFPNGRDPDLISEVDKNKTGANINGHVPGNFQIDNTVHGGDYTRIESESLYPSSLWKSGPDSVHEHFNPGYVENHSPAHFERKIKNTENNSETVRDPGIYGYPADYGLPIPEVMEKENVYRHTIFSGLTIANEAAKEEGLSIGNYPQNSTYSSTQSPAHFSPYSETISVSPRDHDVMKSYRELSPILNTINENEPVDGPVTPRGAGKSWPQNSSKPGVPLGVQVLPPLPGNSVHRIKSRDSPDEGYQEGTDV